VLDSVDQYMSVVIINGLAAILIMIGHMLFGVLMIKTATLPGSGVALGARWLYEWTGAWTRTSPAFSTPALGTAVRVDGCAGNEPA
jgi:hypothetical protein